ncbi:MAG TPA: Ig-like domain-containing protein [Ferruginibacter sp.]|nr:Ig-like domain-containing protein [Ferruginibacter sp.]
MSLKQNKQHKGVKFAFQKQLMRLSHFLYILGIISLLYGITVTNAGCAQIGAPTGGPRDSLPPRLVSALPQLNSTNISGNRITLNFNEYIELKEPQTNILISPYPKRSPNIDFKLRAVTVRLRDTLMPNTTYSINFGNAIVDINEGNALKDFTYVFSTGSTIDSLTLSGKVILAETGKVDSTMIAMLYRNADDSAVQKIKPDYIARLKGDGTFSFVNLPPGSFKIYALKDGDGGRTYNSKKELFAFSDTTVIISAVTAPVLLYASALEKESSTTTARPLAPDRKLRYTPPAAGQQQDLASPFELVFNKPLKKFEPAKLLVTDTNYKPVPAQLSIDSSRTKVLFTYAWQPGMQYRLILDSTAVSDSSNNSIAKTDTIRFTAKSTEDYGTVVLRFSNLDLAKNPVLQFVSGETVKESYPLTGTEWSKKLMEPGEYEVRILFDDNKNGKWDPGDYSKKLQPEKVSTLSQKLAIKANWDNERDIKL